MAAVAVVGATGAVGREMVAVLEERGFAVTDLRLLASKRSNGRTLSAFGREHEVRPAEPGASARRCRPTASSARRPTSTSSASRRR